MNTIILCGGKGTRLKPITHKIPKPMVQVNGKPILWYIMNQLKNLNLNKLFVAIGYKAEYIRDYFDKNFIDMNVSLIDNGNVNIIERVKAVVAINPNEDLLILYGDTISDVNLKNLLSFSEKNLKSSILTVWPLRTNFGVVELDDQMNITGFKEKPKLDKYINIGYFILRKNMFNYLNNFDNYADFLTFCGNKRSVKAYIHDGEHFTVNNVVELEIAEKNITKIKL
jgi:glucose-1-phosphate cytidylyltransferase